MATQIITVSGGFHNSPALTLRVKDGALSVGQYKRYASHMCGIKGCICGLRHGVAIDGTSRDAFADMLDDASYRATVRTHSDGIARP